MFSQARGRPYLAAVILVVTLAACGGGTKTTAGPASTRPSATVSATATTRPSVAVSATATTPAGTAAGVRRLALTAAQIPADFELDGETTDLDVDSWEFCNQRWRLNSHRVAQKYQAWISTSEPLRLEAQIVIAYDSTMSARLALSEFRDAASSCNPYSGPLLGRTASASLEGKAQDFPAALRPLVHGYPGFLVNRKVAIEARHGYVVDALIQHQQYLIICSEFTEDENQVGVGAGSMTRLSAAALSRL